MDSIDKDFIAEVKPKKIKSKKETPVTDAEVVPVVVDYEQLA